MLRLRRHRTYHFTEAVRRVLAASREEALRLRHAKLEPEHILLGFVRAGDEAVMERLRDLDLAPQKVSEAVQAVLPAGASKQSSAGELPFSAAAKKVLEYAKDEATRLNDPTVDTLHLLLGVLRAEDRPVVERLRGCGLTKERLISVVPTRSSAAFRVRIDDAAPTSIYEQIVAQITEAIATGALQAGVRLPTVRQLADELDVAPGTVARAYSRLEEQGIVVTEGVRGTRVAERPVRPDPVQIAPENLAGLLRPVVVAAFHLGASASALRDALEQAMRGIFPEDGGHE
ncbi:MAG: GntR family transcriptional regulator [Chloroflexota bacterium]|nr:GntR family transcriptional regulator [Chloroflexota bacterium]